MIVATGKEHPLHSPYPSIATPTQKVFMPHIAIVYFSQDGTTALLAEAIAHGATQAGAQSELLRIEESQFTGSRWKDDTVLDRLAQADAIVFGAPTFMGGVAAPFKAFADATSQVWFHRGWVGKLAGGFTISGSASGDKLHSLAYLSIFAAQHGMLWANWDAMPRQPDGTNRFGNFLGLAAQNPAPPGTPPALETADAVSADRYGRYLAALTTRLGTR